MATFRGVNNAKGVAEPLELIKKNEQSGEVKFSIDSLELPAISNGDVVLMQIIPANAKVLRVKLLTDSLAAGAVDVGFSASNAEGLEDKDATVAADDDAFIAAGDPDGVAELNMAVGAVGFLSEREKDVYLTLTFDTAPTGAAGNTVTTIVEYVTK